MVVEAVMMEGKRVHHTVPESLVQSACELLSFGSLLPHNSWSCASGTAVEVYNARPTPTIRVARFHSASVNIITDFVGRVAHSEPVLGPPADSVLVSPFHVLCAYAGSKGAKLLPNTLLSIHS